MKKKDYYVTINNKTVTVSEEIYRVIKQDDWRQAQQRRRNRKCRDENGNRCQKQCGLCPLFQTGQALSLEKLLTDGQEPIGTEDISDIAIKNNLIAAMKSEIYKLDTESQRILWLFGDGLSEREIAQQLNLTSSTVHYRKTKLFKELYNQLKHYM